MLKKLTPRLLLTITTLAAFAMAVGAGWKPVR
jgi:hypothetical protein